MIELAADIGASSDALIQSNDPDLLSLEDEPHTLQI